MAGIIFSVIAGMLTSIQGVFNTRVSEKAGLWETVAFVHGVGLMLALSIILFAGGEGFKRIGEVDRLYLLGGAMGVFIVFSLMQGISSLGAAYSIAIALVAQLIIATIIDSFGLFGTPALKLSLPRILGILTMIVGILIFSYQSNK